MQPVDMCNRFGALSCNESIAPAASCQQAPCDVQHAPIVSRWSSRKVGREPRAPVQDNLIEEISRAPSDGQSEIGAVSSFEGQWERISVKIDSGAIDTVMPPSVGQHFGVRRTNASVNGPGFKAANGSAIAHYGQREIKGISDQFAPLNLIAQVADVKSTLGSVNQMLIAGNRVHFERGNCYIESERTGHRTPIVERNGTFEVGVWVPKSCDSQSSSVVNSSSAKAPCNQSVDGRKTQMSGFHRQDRGQ